MLFTLLKWYLIITISSAALLGLIYLYDRIKYGPLKIYNEDH